MEVENEKAEEEKEKAKHYILDHTGKEIVLNVFNYFKKTYNISRAVAEASKATGVSERVVYRIKKEAETNSLKPPEKRGRKPKDSVEQMTVCDEYTKCGIRKLVSSFFSQNISPTLNTLLSAIKNDETLQNLSRTSLHRLLKNIGFKFELYEKRNVLCERDDIIKWRHNYLRTIKRYRDEGRAIIYTDESWVGMGEPESISVLSQKGLEENKKDKKIRKSRIRAAMTRFIIFHAGSEQGFINGAEYHFLCKKHTVDPLYEVEIENYEKWFQEKLLPNTPENCVIVLDNALYHSKRMEENDEEKLNSKVSKPPRKKRKIDDSLKQESQQQQKESIKNDEDLPKYRIDELAETSGRVILRIPPYHCELNVMELVWNKVRQIITDNRCSITEAYKHVTLEDWNDFINKVKKIELEMWISDNVQNDTTNSMRVEAGPSSL